MYPFYEVKKSDRLDYFSISTGENITFPPHLHSYVELIYVLEGNIKVTINDNMKNLEQGEIAISFPNDIHSYNTTINSKHIILIFSPEIISGYFNDKVDKTLEIPFFYKREISETIYLFLNILKEEYIGTNNEYVIKGLLYSIFGKLDMNFKLKNSKYSNNSTIQSLLRFIESNYNENLTLDSVAKGLGFSKFYISRLFTKRIGYQFNDYLNRLRINKAQILLREEDMQISNIAMECGFESLRNFNRAFKQYTRITPTEYRRLKKYI